MSNSISVELAEFLVSASDESSGEIGIDASYSGRCMYGQTCLGLTFENIQVRSACLNLSDISDRQTS